LSFLGKGVLTREDHRDLLELSTLTLGRRKRWEAENRILHCASTFLRRCPGNQRAGCSRGPRGTTPRNGHGGWAVGWRTRSGNRAQPRIGSAGRATFCETRHRWNCRPSVNGNLITASGRGDRGTGPLVGLGRCETVNRAIIRGAEGTKRTSAAKWRSRSPAVGIGNRRRPEGHNSLRAFRALAYEVTDI
jgi:hypothetical protein